MSLTDLFKGLGAVGDSLNAAILRRIIERGRVYLPNAWLGGNWGLTLGGPA